MDKGWQIQGWQIQPRLPSGLVRVKQLLGLLQILFIIAFQSLQIFVCRGAKPGANETKRLFKPVGHFGDGGFSEFSAVGRAVKGQWIFSAQTSANGSS